MAPIKRREFLKTATLATAGTALVGSGCGVPLDEEELSSEMSALTSVQANLDKFPQNAWAGSMTTDTVVLTTRHPGGGRPPHLRVWKVQSGGWGLVFDGLPQTANYEQGAYYRFVSSNDRTKPGFLNLEPNQDYAYRFYEPGSMQGTRLCRFHTLGKAGTQPVVRFAAGSCNLAVHTNFPVLQDAANVAGLDFFIHMGDSIYADIVGGSPNTEEGFNRCYQQFWARPGWQDLHTAAGMMSTWDDHEFRNDRIASDYDTPAGRAARDAYVLNMGLRRQAEDPDRIWRSFAHGDTAEFFLLDLRSERRPGQDEIISDKQLRWLKQGLSDSRAHFKIIIAPQPLTDFPGAKASSWSFTHQRHELLNHIKNLQQNGKRGFFFLGGDVHFSAAGSVNAPGTDFGDINEFVIGPLGNPGNGMSPERKRAFGAHTGPNKQLQFTSGHNNFAHFVARPPSGGNGAELDVEYCIVDSNVDHAGNLSRRVVKYRATYAASGRRTSVAICDPDTVIR
ncbi:MAG: alkaline phosphatase D family protein [Myxococcaceae bacterium]|nr:alkaline phosphatase D family protein [Myxococcaceae bacterium]